MGASRLPGPSQATDALAMQAGTVNYRHLADALGKTHIVLVNGARFRLSVKDVQKCSGPLSSNGGRTEK